MVRSIPGVGEHDLLHLAFVDGATTVFPEDVGRAVATSCKRAALAAREAFALVPGLQAFSWLAPPLDHLLARAAAPAAAHACAAGVRVFSRTAADLGATLRVCGRRGGLPTASALPARGGGRTLLWFQRYSAREEIVRAAEWFLRTHPGKVLADEELAAGLDTAGMPDPDLLIYSGGPPELQNLLLWQGSYAEIWHSPEPDPAFPGGHLRQSVADYLERQRRFGR